MPRPPSLTSGLKENILSVVSEYPDRARVNSLVEVCRTLAASFLSNKASAGSLASVHGVSINDLAYDCIADLFRQDGNGAYLELQSYFSGITPEEMKDEELLPHLRRLVFSKVNQGVFRLFGESDPSLSKILRNVKLAVSALKNFTEVERFGEAYLAPSLVDTLEHLPPFEREELARRFFEETTGKELIPQLLAKLSLLLREQEEYCRIVPLIGVGILIRRVYEGKRAGSEEPDEIETTVGVNDVIVVIRAACHDVRVKARNKYVGSGKLCENIFCCYFRAIETELLNRFHGRAAEEHSLFSALREHLPDIGREEYMAEHRSRLEYFLKLVGARVSVRLQREL